MVTHIPGYEEYLEKERKKSLIKAIELLIKELNKRSDKNE